MADLSKDDFEVFEDGVKQDIASLTLVHGGRVHNLRGAAAGASAEGHHPAARRGRRTTPPGASS